MLQSISKAMGAGLLLILLLPGLGLADDAAEESCFNNLAALKKKQDFVNQLGGIWGLFEQTSILRGNSSKAVQLDSKINELLWVSKYLCETLEGVPPNDLARYLIENIDSKGRKQFRRDLTELGISDGEINEFFEFVDFSRSHEDRQLDVDSVKKSIRRAGIYLKRYKELAEEIKNSPGKEHLEQAVELTRDIDALESDDANLALGLWETHQVPRWDLDGSVGGS